MRTNNHWKHAETTEGKRHTKQKNSHHRLTNKKSSATLDSKHDKIRVRHEIRISESLFVICINYRVIASGNVKPPTADAPPTQEANYGPLKRYLEG